MHDVSMILVESLIVSFAGAVGEAVDGVEAKSTVERVEAAATEERVIAIATVERHIEADGAGVKLIVAAIGGEREAAGEA